MHFRQDYFAFSFQMQVLATGLSGLYSSLPTKLEEKGEEWHCLLKDDWLLLPPLVQFMNSLEFCNAVIQVGTAAVEAIRAGVRSELKLCRGLVCVSTTLKIHPSSILRSMYGIMRLCSNPIEYLERSENVW